jgi:DNA-binding SARP family transcriptional activator
VRALDCLAEIWLANDEPALAVEAARESLALEPFRESGYRRLNRMDTSPGNRAEALRVYESCRELLESELGAELRRRLADARQGRGETIRLFDCAASVAGWAGPRTRR